MKANALLIMSVLMISLVACDRIEMPSTNDKKEGTSNLSIIEIPNDLTYSFYVFRSRTELYVEANDTSYNFSGSESNYNYAYFPAYAGTVKINGTTLSNASQNNSGSYYSFSSTLPLTGEYIEISASGNLNVPEIVDSIKSPKNFASIKYPVNGSIISDNSNLTIQWDEEKNMDMRVAIEIAAKTNDSTKTNYAFYYDIDDNGSFTLPSSFLQQFTKGLVEINLMRGYYKINQADNNKFYGIVAYTQHTITVKLTD
jgi:hypothetical protein